jgi:hypothetical protein
LKKPNGLYKKVKLNLLPNRNKNKMHVSSSSV